MTNIDGIVAIMLFVAFVAWSFAYFFSVFPGSAGLPLSSTLDSVSGSIVSYLAVDFYTVPVRHTSTNTSANAVFYFDYVWPSEGAKNSTKVYNNIGSKLSCNITGNRLYWKDDAEEGANYFTITYSDRAGSMNCSGGDLGNPVNKTLPWSAVKKSRVSLDKISDMAGTGYAAFKGGLGIERDFRVELNISGSITAYGLPTPNATSVFAKTTRHATEDGQQAEIRVMIW